MLLKKPLTQGWGGHSRDTVINEVMSNALVTLVVAEGG